MEVQHCDVTKYNQAPINKLYCRRIGDGKISLGNNIQTNNPRLLTKYIVFCIIMYRSYICMYI